MKLLCFDIGGTSIKYGIVKDGNILFKDSFPTNYKRGHKDVTDRLISTSKAMMKRFKNIEGVAISCAGSINYDQGVMITPPNAIPQFGDWNFTKLFKEELGLDIVADNDVNSFAICEEKLGNGNKYSTYIVMTVGTGIGGAIIVNDKIWRGRDYNAGEIGRMIVDGAHWETIASMSALVRSAKLRGLSCENGKDVFDLYDAGNEVAGMCVREFYQNLGKGIANLIYIFNPEAIIIGGGISQRENFGKEIIAYADYYLVTGFKNTIDILPATFKNDGGMLGAYCNFIEKYKK